ncbi:MAG TPA: hypothetical protein VFE12_04460, partial [Acetobacteraceae bacterium]|nr:hypothetical protein [Acetobacteraceae bacterium]
MSDPRPSITTPDPDDPLPEHSRVDQCFAPERVLERRMILHQTVNTLMRDEAHLAPRQRAQTVVHHA